MAPPVDPKPQTNAKRAPMKSEEASKPTIVGPAKYPIVPPTTPLINPPRAISPAKSHPRFLLLQGIIPAVVPPMVAPSANNPKKNHYCSNNEMSCWVHVVHRVIVGVRIKVDASHCQRIYVVI